MMIMMMMRYTDVISLKASSSSSIYTMIQKKNIPTQKSLARAQMS